MFKIIVLLMVITLLSCSKSNKKTETTEKKELSKVEKRKELPLEIQNAVDLFKNKDVNSAYKEFIKLVKKYPENWEVNYYIGIIAARGQNLELATKYLNKATDIYPKGWQAYTELATLYKSRYDYKNALKIIKNVFKYEQKDALSNFMIAFLALRLKDKSVDVIKHYKQAINLNLNIH